MSFYHCSRIFIFIAVVFAGTGLSSANKRNLEFAQTFLTLNEAIEKDEVLRSEYEASLRAIDVVEPPPAEFTCDTSDRSSSNPTSVHQVRPSDIKVIAAFGDSITAGNGLGARTLPEVALENRGESWSIGGEKSLEEGVVTLPNIMKKFNPDLKGYSMCNAREEDEYRSWFNVAVPGAKNDDMLSQSEFLVPRMKADPRVDFENDWKLLTMFVGGNDLCGSCRGRDSPPVYYANFEQALLYLQANMPRTIVNLVSMFDISPLQNFSRGLSCDLLQWGFCGCARNFTTLKDMRPLQLEYSEKLRLLSEDSRFQTDGFAVVLQPHMRDMTPPIDPDTGTYPDIFLSPDCFHPTRISHQAFAIWLWNAMLIPVGFKPTHFPSSVTSIPISCPTQKHPYIFTNVNSRGIITWPEESVSGVATHLIQNKILMFGLMTITLYISKKM